MRRFVALALLSLALGMAWASSAQAGRRVAVLVGVSDYGGLGNLDNPEHDAEQMARTLSRLGYDVHTLLNPAPSAVERVLTDLRKDTGAIDQFVFFFSGHGGSVDGAPMLVMNGGGRHPAVVALSTLVADIEKLHPAATVYMLDACRSNAGVDLPGIRPGLEQPPRTTGAFFAYAAAPGDVAYDAGRSAPDLSPFTFALSDELLVPGQDIGVVLRKVRERVSLATGGRQLPWTEDSLTGPLVLNDAPAAPQLFDLYGRALKGDPAAQRDLGNAYLNGGGVAQDVERGTALLQEAAAQNDVPAMLALGDFEAARDRNALRPNSKAFEWYTRAAGAGSGDGYYRLAELGRQGLKPEERPAEGLLNLYDQAAKLGQSDARARYLGYNLAYVFDSKLDRAATIAALRTAAADGNVLSAVMLGRVYGQPGSPEFDGREADFWLDKAVRAGSTEAMLEQAKLYGQGRGVGRDLPRSFKLTLMAAERGDAEAMLFTGRMLIHATGTAADPEAAAAWFRKASEAGNSEALAELGTCYEQGLGVDVDLKQAVALYRRGFELNDPVSTRALAIMYEGGLGVRRNMDRAIGYYEHAAELGDERARASLAIQAGNGMLTGIPDPALGYRMLKAAVEHSTDREYIYKLASIAEAGVAGPPDPAEAARLYQRALDLGSAEAANELGSLYFTGNGVAQDRDRAIALWRRAAEGGDSAAYGNLANAARQDGDLPEAGRWARRGAEAGEPEAMVMYARDLLSGQEGFTRDPAAAFDWLGKALAQENQWAAGTLKSLALDSAPANAADQSAAQALLDRAAHKDHSALAAAVLAQIDMARDGFDPKNATHDELLAQLKGPHRGRAALLLGAAEADGRSGGKPDDVAAERYFRIAAEAGLPAGWERLGELQTHNLVPGATQEAALADFHRAADGGDRAAMNYLGLMHYRGIGVKRDDSQALGYFRQAAAAGSAAGMYYLGVAYQNGRGVPASLEQAEDWFSKAVDAGYAPAEIGLASVLLNAPAEDRDYSRAFFYLVRIASRGDADAFTSFGELCANADLPPWVRRRALSLLTAFPDSADAKAKLAQLTSAQVIRQNDGHYGLSSDTPKN